MKKLTVLMLVTFTVVSCSKEELPSESNVSQKTATNTSAISSESNSKIRNYRQSLNSDSEITITEISRSFYSSVHFKNQVMSKTSSGIVPPTSTKLTAYQWKELNNLFSKLNLREIPYYTETTCLRCSDSSPAGNLTIIHQGRVYQSLDYDSYNPPVALRAFLNYAKSL